MQGGECRRSRFGGRRVRQSSVFKTKKVVSFGALQGGLGVFFALIKGFEGDRRFKYF